MKEGILVISHGSREMSWIANVEQIVQKAKQSFALENEQYAAVPIVPAYLELVDGQLIQDGIDRLEQEGVTHLYVMPLFISYGSTHVEEIKQAFGIEPAADFIGDLEPYRCQAKVFFADPIVDEPEVLHILEEQIKKLSTKPEQEGLLLIGHGSSYDYFYERWQVGMEQMLLKLTSQHAFAKADYASLLPEQSYEVLAKLQSHHDVQDVIVLPLFISPGYFTSFVIPKRLNGLSYKYNGETLLPHEQMINLLHRRFIEMIRDEK